MNWFWVGLLLAMAIPAHADVLPSPEAARDLADKVMEFISKGDVDNGLALVKPYTGLAGVEIDGLGQKLKEVFVSGKYRLGNSIGYEFLGKETLGSSLLRITELHRFQKHALEWIFTFYKGPDGWTTNHVFYTDKLEDMFHH